VRIPGGESGPINGKDRGPLHETGDPNMWPIAAEVDAYRGATHGVVYGTVTATSMENRKTDARTIEFRPAIAGGGEAVIRYTVHYT
jgi:hypothetical protein